jgi:histidinol-phosphatase (PHP family)
MRIDYHTHTSFSQDSNATMQSQCDAAVARSIQEIAFTEHEDYNSDDPTAFYFDHAAYHAEVERLQTAYANKLVIVRGIEISEPHRYPTLAAKTLKAYSWDFVLGSLHWLTPEVNCFVPTFFEHLGNWRESMRRYFVEMRAMVEHGDFDVLAHLDYPARYHRRLMTGGYDLRAWEPEIRDVLAELIRRSKGIEINMSPVRRNLDPNPAPVVIGWYREMGGELLTVGTDSHTPQDTGHLIDNALNIARAAGFTHVTTYRRRVPSHVPIDG